MDLSPLNKLSAELRNQIYELVLVHEHPVSITADDYCSRIRATSFPESYPLALLITCKQINRESTALFYGSNTFHFEFPASTSEEDRDELCLVQRFFGTMGDAALLGLRDVHVHVCRTFGSYLLPKDFKLFSRHLLGLQGISALNEELRIGYTIAVQPEWQTAYVWHVGKPVKATIQVQDMENTLKATIASFGAGADVRPQRLLCEELKLFQETTFGSGSMAKTRYLLMPR